MPKSNALSNNCIQCDDEIVLEDLEYNANTTLYIVLTADGITPDLNDLSNHYIRIWYKAFVASLSQTNEQWKNSGVNTKERARRCFEMRHAARIISRDFMSKNVTGKIERKFLEARDYHVYGNKDGPTFDYLKEQKTSNKKQEYKLNGKFINDDEILEQVFQAIINSSIETNEMVNRYVCLDKEITKKSEHLEISDQELDKYLYYRFDR